MLETIRGLKTLNRDIWDFLPRLEQHLSGDNGNPDRATARFSSEPKNEKRTRKNNNQR
jgi:hypothetical protein